MRLIRLLRRESPVGHGVHSCCAATNAESRDELLGLFKEPGKSTHAGSLQLLPHLGRSKKLALPPCILTMNPHRWTTAHTNWGSENRCRSERVKRLNNEASKRTKAAEKPPFLSFK